MADYISREKAIETIRYRVCQGQGNKEHICKRGSCAYCGIMEIISDISGIKAADVQPIKYGRWISLDYDTYFECSVCKNIEDIESNFCSRCGADMQNREWLKR